MSTQQKQRGVAPFTTRRPTGNASWPLVILSGVEGSGKTWAAAEATGIPLIGRSFFLEIGERMADEYGAVPGADFEIIEHDGSFDEIYSAARWAAAQPLVDGKPPMLIIDSMTELWGLLSDEAQHIANDRRRGRKNPGGDAQITMDLWNRAKDRLNGFLDVCRGFPGPVLMTARLDNVSVVEGGRPTGELVWKIRCEKNLPYQATVIMQARQPRQWLLTKIASTRLQLPPEGQRPWPGFTVAKLFEEMGVGADMAPSTFVRPEPGAGDVPSIVRARIKALADAGDLDGLRSLWNSAPQHVDAGLVSLVRRLIEQAVKRAEGKRTEVPEVPERVPEVSQEVPAADGRAPRGPQSRGHQTPTDPGVIDAEIVESAINPAAA